MSSGEKKEPCDAVITASVINFLFLMEDIELANSVHITHTREMKDDQLEKIYSFLHNDIDTDEIKDDRFPEQFSHYLNNVSSFILGERFEMKDMCDGECDLRPPRAPRLQYSTSPENEHIPCECVSIKNLGCGYCIRLQLTGRWQGSIFYDYTAGDGKCILFKGDFYEFLEYALSNQLCWRSKKLGLRFDGDKTPAFYLSDDQFTRSINEALQL